MSKASYSIGVISDTHGYLNPEVFNIFRGVDLILHAGDVEGDDLLTELETLAPIQAISGNVDFPANSARRPLERRIETPAGRIAMTHGHLAEAPSQRPEMMVKHFADFAPEILIYGHSHVPKLEFVHGTMVFNPGSAGAPRFGHGPSVGLIRREQGNPPAFNHHSLPWEPRGRRR